MTQDIKILGTGCPKCKTLQQLTQEVITENKLDASLEKVDDIMEIMTYNVMVTPALVLNGKVLTKGRVPAKTELLALLQNTSTATNNTATDCCGTDACCS